MGESFLETCGRLSGESFLEGAAEGGAENERGWRRRGGERDWGGERGDLENEEAS